MVKIGLLFVDVPENCLVCPFHYKEFGIPYLECIVPDGVSYEETSLTHRPIGCPIKVYEVRANEKGNEINN